MTDYQTTRLKLLQEKERKGKLSRGEAVQLKRLLTMKQHEPGENKMMLAPESNK